MPDGTKTNTKPKDGEKFAIVDMITGTQTDWMWDDFQDLWFNVSSGNKPNKQNTATFAIPPSYKYSIYRFDNDKEAMSFDLEFNKSLGIKCECGSEKCGSDRHSTWCPKFAQ